jgi:hypothetical protein
MIGFELFMCNLGGRRRRAPFEGPELSVRYHTERARILTLYRTCGPRDSLKDRIAIPIDKTHVIHTSVDENILFLFWSVG